MADATSPRLRRVAVCTALVAVVVAAAAVLLTAPAGSQTGSGPDPSSCEGDFVIAFGTPRDGTRIEYRVGTYPLPELGIVTERTVELTSPIAPGQYAVTAITYDGYDGRASWPAEPHEQVTFEFLDASGALLASTAATPDLEDGVDETTWSGNLGVLTWSGPPAAKIRVVHLPEQPGDTSYNKLDPICLGLAIVAPPTTTTVPVPTTTAPPRTTAPVPTTTAPADQPGTEVEGAVELPPAAPAIAQVAEPRFTG